MRFKSLKLWITNRFPLVVRLIFVNTWITLITFLTGVVLARALAPQGRGEFAVITLWAQTLSTVGLFGVHQYLSREIAQNPRLTSSLYLKGYWIVFLLSIGSAVIFSVGIALGLLPDILNSSYFILAGYVIIISSAINGFQIYIELGRKSFVSYNICRSIFAVCFLVVSIGLFVTRNSNAFSYVLAFAAASVIAALVGSVVIQRTVVRIFENSKNISSIDIIKRARPYGIVVFVTAALTQGDKLLVSLLFSTTALGIFVVASSVSQVQHTIGEAISQLFYSRMASIRDIADVDEEWLGEKLRQSLTVTIIVGFLSIISLPYLVPFIYGEAYLAIVELLYFFIPATAVRVAVRPYEELFRGLGMPIVSMKIVGIGTIAIAIGVVLSAQWQSIYGVAFAVCLGNMISLALAALFAHKILGVALADCLLPRKRDLYFVLRRMHQVVSSR